MRFLSITSLILSKFTKIDILEIIDKECEETLPIIPTGAREKKAPLRCQVERTLPSINFIGNLNLSSGKIHEIYGNSRTTLALIIAQKMQGHIFWIRKESNLNHLNADGIIDFINPGRLTFINVKTLNEIL